MGKLFGLLAMSNQLAESYALRSLLSKLALLAALTVTAGVALGVLFAFMLYGGYLILMAQGLSQIAALLTVLGLALVLAIVLALMAGYQIRNASRHKSHSIADKLKPIADSFLEGFLNDPAAQASKKQSKPGSH